MGAGFRMGGVVSRWVEIPDEKEGGEGMEWGGGKARHPERGDLGTWRRGKQT